MNLMRRTNQEEIIYDAKRKEFPNRLGYYNYGASVEYHGFRANGAPVTIRSKDYGKYVKAYRIGDEIGIDYDSYLIITSMEQVSKNSLKVRVQEVGRYGDKIIREFSDEIEGRILPLEPVIKRVTYSQVDIENLAKRLRLNGYQVEITDSGHRYYLEAQLEAVNV